MRRGITRLLLAALPAAALAAATLPPAPAAAATALGYDISWPQCGGGYPAAPYDVAIVGVTGGRTNTANACLASEYAWAVHANFAPHLYINSDCNATCAASPYGYGYGAAGYAVRYAHSQGVDAQIWWLDVESGPSWSSPANNAAMVQGQIDALRANGKTPGIYSTSYQFGQLVGSYWPNVPSWTAGASTRTGASQLCAPGYSFTNGPVWMVQYPNGAFDGDLACGGGPFLTGPGGVALDSSGALHGFGSQPSPGSVAAQLHGPARGMARVPYTGLGYVVDGEGDIIPFGGSTRLRPSQTWPGQDVARAIALRPDGLGGYVVDRAGGIHPFGNAPAVLATQGVVRNAPDDIVGLVLRPDEATSGYVLHSTGAVTPFGGAPRLASPDASYAAGVMIAITMNVDGLGGYLLDRGGHLHGYGNAPTPAAAAGSKEVVTGTSAGGGVVPLTDTSGYVVAPSGALIAYGGAEPVATSVSPAVTGASVIAAG